MTHEHLCPACQELFRCADEDCAEYIEIYCLDCYGIALSKAA